MKIFLQFIIGFLVSFQAFGQEAAEMPSQETKDTTIAKTAYEPVTNSLLWAVTGNGLEDTSYVYGTIHLIPKDDFFLTEQTKEAFDASDKVVFEIDIDGMSDMMSQFGLLMKAFMGGGQTLKDFLAAEEYDLVKAHFAKKGMTDFIWNMMERIKPMFLSMFASTDLSGDGNPLMSGDMVSYEMELMAKAKLQKKTMAGLETAEYQMSMFDSIPYEAQAKMLLQSIQVEADSSSAATDEMDKMVELYKNHDINGMITMFDEDTEGIGKYEEFLLLNRNRNWIPVMGKMMAAQPTFFGVGAGHLAGEEGVINLLKNKGYTVTPLNDKTVKPVMRKL